MKLIKIVLKFTVLALSGFFDKKTYSPFDMFCYFGAFYVIHAFLEKSEPTFAFYFSVFGTFALIAFVSGFLDAAFSDAKSYLSKRNKDDHIDCEALSVKASSIDRKQRLFSWRNKD